MAVISRGGSGSSVGGRGASAAAATTATATCARDGTPGRGTTAATADARPTGRPGRRGGGDHRRVADSAAPPPLGIPPPARPARRWQTHPPCIGRVTQKEPPVTLIQPPQPRGAGVEDGHKCRPPDGIDGKKGHAGGGSGSTAAAAAATTATPSAAATPAATAATAPVGRAQPQQQVLPIIQQLRTQQQKAAIHRSSRRKGVRPPQPRILARHVRQQPVHQARQRGDGALAATQANLGGGCQAMRQRRGGGAPAGGPVGGPAPRPTGRGGDAGAGVPRRRRSTAARRAWGGATAGCPAAGPRDAARGRPRWCDHGRRHTTGNGRRATADAAAGCGRRRGWSPTPWPLCQSTPRCFTATRRCNSGGCSRRTVPRLGSLGALQHQRIVSIGMLAQCSLWNEPGPPASLIPLADAEQMERLGANA